MSNGIAAVILAGGRSKRMGGGIPKPLRVVGGQTLLARVAETLAGAGLKSVSLVAVVSPGFEKAAAGISPQVRWALQPEAKGTGDAARWGLEALAGDGDPMVIVALADVAFTEAATYKALMKRCPDKGIAFVSAEVPEPASLGRVLRDKEGRVQDIVEFKELSPGQEAIREINVGHFCGRRSLLLNLIGAIKPGAKGGELYLTSIVAEARRRDLPVEGIKTQKLSEALGANTPEELEALARMAEAERK